jgi:formate hydrogenlyase subunit 6/NADH:ubiquinone oxidoreductase subunit I
MDLPFLKEAVTGLFSKTSCEMYPFKPSEAAPRYRGRIVFHPDKCINCSMCERVCAGGAIKSVAVPVEGGSQITRSFNLGSCTFCSHCADFCNHGAIELSSDYHMVATKEEDLIVSGTFFKAAPKKPAPKPAAPAAPKTEAAPAASALIKPRDDGKPVQVPSKCVYCTLCAKKCPAGALTVDRAARRWTLDEESCVACGTCATVCPKKAILMPGDEPVAVEAPKAESPKAEAAPKA